MLNVIKVNDFCSNVWTFSANDVGGLPIFHQLVVLIFMVQIPISNV